MFSGRPIGQPVPRQLGGQLCGGVANSRVARQSTQPFVFAWYGGSTPAPSARNGGKPYGRCAALRMEWGKVGSGGCAIYSDLHTHTEWGSWQTGKSPLFTTQPHTRTEWGIATVSISSSSASAPHAHGMGEGAGARRPDSDLGPTRARNGGTRGAVEPWRRPRPHTHTEWGFWEESEPQGLTRPHTHTEWGQPRAMGQP